MTDHIVTGNKKVDWKLVNPCIGCTTDLKYERDHGYDFENNCYCQTMYSYISQVEAQKRLLEYLKDFIHSHKESPLYFKIRLMLKELEELK
jgi:hypothetical protein